MPKRVDAFEQCAKEYDSWFERNVRVYKAELRAIKGALPPAGRGLEIGVGTGRFAGPLGIHTGIDPSPAMAAIARTRGIEVIIGKAELLPFAAEEFDYAVMITTICFVDDMDRAFREAARVLKTSGCLVVGFIDRDSLLGKLYEARKDRDKFYHDARFYSVEEVTNRMREAGFEEPIAWQTVFCSAGSIAHEQLVKPGHGEGSFVVLKSMKRLSSHEL